MIAIIDYGVGNLGSIRNMLKKVGHRDVVISAETDILSQAHKLILPGVGHFDYGMKKLKASGLVDHLQKWALMDKKPILGICLGLQLMTKGSSEGEDAGLGWLDAETIAFDAHKIEPLKVPHMGWTEVSTQGKHDLMKGMFADPRFYFVHSYHLTSTNQDQILLTASYGNEFVAGMAKDNIMGVQFHPEKSHKFGMVLMKNFAEL